MANGVEDSVADGGASKALDYTTPDGRTVLVANHGDGTVSVLDLKEQRFTGNFMAGTGIESGTYY